MWTDTTRAQHARSWHGLPSNLTDEEWALIEPLLPARSGLGRPAKWTYRQIMPDYEWLVLCVARGPAIADVAARRVCANDDGPALFLRVARQRFVAELEPLSFDGRARSVRKRSFTDGGRD